jgi:uncharacterized membrane protein YczE/cytidylate kinase
MKMKQLIYRYLLLALSLFIVAFGVSLISHSTLGSPPISCLAFVLSLHTPLSLGFYMLGSNILLIVGQLILLGRSGIGEFKKELILQIPISIFFSLFIDLSMKIVASIHPSNYLWSLGILAAGCCILAIGIVIEVIADVAMNSGEYIVQIATKKFKKEFGIVKLINDIILVLLALMAALLLGKGHLDGVREGTIIVAVITGPLVKIFSPYFAWLRLRLNKLSLQDIEKAQETNHYKHIVIAIAREYGSGGHEVGEIIAQKLNIPFYDKEIIEKAAIETGFSEDFIKDLEQNIPNNVLFDLIYQDYEVPLEKSLSSSDALFVAQSRIICQLAEKGPSVIVGRLADYILRDKSRCISVFIHSDMQHKYKRVVEQYDIEPSQAEAHIEHINKARSNHYKHYTNSTWGNAANYCITLDTGILGIEQTADIIINLYQNYGIVATSLPSMS